MNSGAGGSVGSVGFSGSGGGVSDSVGLAGFTSSVGFGFCVCDSAGGGVDRTEFVFSYVCAGGFV